MILAGQLLLDEGGGRCRISPGFVRTDGEQIVEVVEGELPPNPDLGGPHALISPGFIDAHLHLPQFPIIGAHGMPLLQWLRDVTFPVEAKWADVGHARSETQRAVRQLIAHGTTAIAAFATVHHESAAAALQIAGEAGMRGVIGQVLMDRQAPPELCGETQQLLDEAAALGEKFPASIRMAAAVTPRFAVACSDELLQGAASLSWEQRATLQSHLAETAAECELVTELFDGRGYVEVYHEAGLLTERAVLGHGVCLDDLDRSTVAQTGAVVAHCPTANSFLRSGTMDRAALRRDDVRLALGSDIGAGYERNMVRVARAMIEAAAQIGAEIPDAAVAWHAITAGNAAALGWDDAGRLQVNAPADLVVAEPDIDWLGPPTDPLATLLFAWDDRWITEVLLQGVRKISANLT